MRTALLPFPLLLLACDPAVIRMKGDPLPPDGPPEDVPVPDIAVPPEFTVGNAIVGTTREAVLVVRNEGAASLDGSVTLSGGEGAFSLDTLELSVDGGGDGLLALRFAPAAEGEATATLEILSNDPDEPRLGVTLRGTGVADADGDGDPDDCDDTDASISTRAQETWYDGVDQDCSGGSDFDADGDGADSDAWGGADCDDANAEVAPSAQEIWYDGADQDCSGGSDFDADGDGFDSADFGGADCDDTDALAAPGAFDTPYDGVDSDCLGDSDFDADDDGYDSAEFGGDDCDDSRADVYPGAAEVPYDGVDADCSGDSDLDADGDGADSVAYGGTDCDDARADIYPGAFDLPYDGEDADCSGGSDFDGDGDGADALAYGGTDCDDSRPDVFPGATEVWYDGVDQDCSGGSDFDADADGVDSLAHGGSDCDDTRADVSPAAAEVWYDGVDQDCSGGSDFDADGDGTLASAGGGADCDDSRADAYPGATEVWYDGVDQDCSGGSDFDADADGFEAEAYGGADCDDASASDNPAGTETCDARDNDCDGATDEGVSTTYYADADADGWGSSVTTDACSLPAGYTTRGGDCNDARASDNPAGTEACDGRDNNCDGSTDEGVTTTYYVDADGDGYGSSGTLAACSLPSGYATRSGDCDDGASGTYPLASETCDLVDNDCDSSVDEGLATTTWYRDADGDGFGSASSSTSACRVPTGYVATATDCDDSTSSVSPGLSEAAYDALDNDCDGIQDEMLVATESAWSVRGSAANHDLGDGQVGTTADIDGDGKAELLVGAPSVTTTSGGYTYTGVITFHDIDNRANPASWSAGNFRVINYGDDAFGRAWTELGNGYMAIGSIGEDAGTASDSGAVMVFSPSVALGTLGSSTTVSALYTYVPAGYVYSPNTNAAVGTDVASGDVDGDGYADLLTTGPGDASGRGRMYMIRYTDGYRSTYMYPTSGYVYVRGASSGDALGQSVASGDFNGDGYADGAVCGASVDPASLSNAGACYIVRGRASTSVSDTSVASAAAATITGATASDRIGRSAHGLASGDFDGDGRVDLAIGSASYSGYVSGGGGVAIFRGAALSGASTWTDGSWIVRGDGALGESVTLVDVTRDGVADLVAGAPDAASAKGVVYLLEGGVARGTYTFPADQFASWTGASNGDSLGSTLGGGRDLDADGYADFVIGAPGRDATVSGSTVSNAGRAYVVRGY